MILSGVTLNIFPPNSTINICPMRIMNKMNKKLRQFFKWKALRPVAKERALNIFQNCSMTNNVKNKLNS